MKVVNLRKKFAVVKLWPSIKTAEDECIARFKIAAELLGLECIEIHADGRYVDEASRFLEATDVDFVIHLHYETPKLYDAFSFVALWNPTQFYHQWGFTRCSRNLLTHDDFISCGSPDADDMVSRLIRNCFTHLPPKFQIYHSTADKVHEPTVGDGILFYAGINWEALARGQSRHQELLRMLDNSGEIRIFGPEIFQGVRVWAGYRTYQRELPFDGRSLVDEINKAGVALVLSSDAHKESQLMSNRLFESLAAGAVIICDENPFAKKHFGDSLLYIDMGIPTEDVFACVMRHLDWIRNNREQALSKASDAQKIFIDRFIHKQTLGYLYEKLEARKQELLDAQFRGVQARNDVYAIFLLPWYGRYAVKNHLESIKIQDDPSYIPILAIDDAYSASDVDIFRSELASVSRKGQVWQVAFSKSTSDDNRTIRKIGDVMNELIKMVPADASFLFIAPNERLFSNHIRLLNAALVNNIELRAAASSAILARDRIPTVINSIHERISFTQLDPFHPNGFGRFIFRKSKLPKDLDIVLPYLSRKPIAVLMGDSEVEQLFGATITIDLNHEFPQGGWDEGRENEVIASYCLGAFVERKGSSVELPTLVPDVVDETHKKPNEGPLWWLGVQLIALQRHGLKERWSAALRRIGRRINQ